MYPDIQPSVYHIPILKVANILGFNKKKYKDFESLLWKAFSIEMY
jgi:hypothetical protein